MFGFEYIKEYIKDELEEGKSINEAQFSLIQRVYTGELESYKEGKYAKIMEMNNDEIALFSTQICFIEGSSLAQFS